MHKYTYVLKAHTAPEQSILQVSQFTLYTSHPVATLTIIMVQTVMVGHITESFSSANVLYSNLQQELEVCATIFMNFSSKHTFIGSYVAANQ